MVLLLLLLCIRCCHTFVLLDPITPYARTKGDWVSRAFAYRGPDARTRLEDGLIRYDKRPVAGPRKERRAKARRVNGYKIVAAADPKRNQSAAVDEDGTDFSYFVSAAFGSSAESMYMLIDTGSPDTWVMGDTCKSTACGLHSTFGSSGSNTLRRSKDSFRLLYGNGEVSGTIVTDTVSIAGMELTMPFGIADAVSDNFSNYPMDGILGLARVPAGFGAQSFLQVLSSSKALPANVFGINLQRQRDGTTDGEINFGTIDRTKFRGELTYTETTSNHANWEIPADDMLVDGKACGLRGGRTAIIDAGTSYMLLPPDDARALFANIKGAQTSGSTSWHVPCDSTTSIQVVFSGVGYEISPKDYVGSSAGGDGMCISQIMGVSAVAGNSKAWLLGDTFLKNVYSVYDADKNRVGFGAKTTAPTTAYPSSSSWPAPSESGTSKPGSTMSSGTASAGGPGNTAMSSLHALGAGTGAQVPRLGALIVVLTMFVKAF